MLVLAGAEWAARGHRACDRAERLACRSERAACSERPWRVITGASSGIGAMFARKLAARGYDLLLIARREDRLRSLASELADTYHVAADAMAADLARDSTISNVQRNAFRPRHGSVCWSTTPASARTAIFFEIDIHGQEQMHRVHVLATMRLTHAALSNLVLKSSGVSKSDEHRPNGLGLGARSEAPHRLKPVPRV